MYRYIYCVHILLFHLHNCMKYISQPTTLFVLNNIRYCSIYELLLQQYSIPLHQRCLCRHDRVFWKRSRVKRTQGKLNICWIVIIYGSFSMELWNTCIMVTSICLSIPLRTIQTVYSIHPLSTKNIKF